MRLQLLLALIFFITSNLAQDQRLVKPRTIATSRRWSTNNGNQLEARHTHQPFSQTCNSYYSANTPHAVCNGDRSIMCLSGCIGGITAQNCQSNSTSQLTNRTCSIAFSQTSQDSFLCSTPEGAFTCQGPSSGNIACHGCVSIPNGAVSSNSSLIFNGTSMTGTPEFNSSTVDNQQHSSTTVNRLLLLDSKSLVLIALPAILIYIFA